MDLKLKALLYISRIMSARRQSSASSYESLLRPDITKSLQTMLATTPIAEDFYLCDTTVSQKETEEEIKEIYLSILNSSEESIVETKSKTSKLLDAIANEPITENGEPSSDELSHFDQTLHVDLHLRYIEHFLNNPLPEGFFSLDCNHGWMIYWLLNAYSVLLDGEVPEHLKKPISAKIMLLVIDEGRGGIAGGPQGQIGHAASTYASVLALVLIGDFDSLALIKKGLHQWFLSLKAPNGSFVMHKGGESDARSTYCVLSVAALLNILTNELLEGASGFLLSCQSYEGGFAGVPNTEAHGGYTFCALAALYLTPDGFRDINMESLLRWLSARQLSLEGGFSGRTNKLVDSCYSFWVGGSFALLEAYLDQATLFNRPALTSYILNCCQDDKRGGLRDKPSTRADFYHTNYALCGLSIAEHQFVRDGLYNFVTKDCLEGSVLTIGVNPIFGIPTMLVSHCLAYFNATAN
ncbi:hypothetical protein PUMCH_001814 [Australozyma saopauloensis]|uniref:Protein farnesyltransferase subunit beta n=1 Tax=Australozyma saopauloensis TaxID=291208 RepID=A0AAX4H7H2_9ASCO|nr:hypothetical protein PUMCH_001814 [[Candida] saopauloensis]